MKRPVFLLLLFLTALPSLYAREDKLFAEAESHYKSGNYLLALEAYSEFADLYPLSDRMPDVQYRRALCHLKLGHYQKSLGLFQEVEKRYRSTRYFDYIYFWRGLARYRLGEYAPAVEAFTVFLERVREDELVPQALLYHALSASSLNQYRSAAASLERLVEDHFGSPQGAYGLLLLFHAYLSLEEYASLLAMAERFVAEKLPEKWRPRYRLYLAEALWETGRQEEAGRIYEQLKGEEPDIASIAYRRLFAAAQEKQDLPRMEALLQEAEQRLSSDPEILRDLWVRVGIESYKQENLELAEYFLNRVWNLPDREQIVQAVPLYLAEILIKKGEVARAGELLDEYLELEPEDRGLALLRAGDLQLMQQDYEGAESYFARYREEYPEGDRYAEAGYLQAYARYRQGAWKEALELDREVLGARPESGYRKELLRLQTMLLRRMGEQAEAARLLKEYTRSYPDDLSARLDYLRTLFNLERYGELIRETNLLLEQSPELGDSNESAYLLVRYLRGLALITEKSYSRALEDLEPITETEPGAAGRERIFPYALYYRGWAHYRLREYGRARQWLARFLEDYPTHRLFPQALFLSGWCSYSLEEYRTAASTFARRAKMAGEDSDRAAFLQGKSLLNLGEFEEAVGVFRNLMRNEPDSSFADDALFEYAGAQARLGKSVEAAESYLSLVRRYPQSPLVEEALFKRGEVYLEVELFEEAKDAYFEYRSRFPRGELVGASLYWGGMAAERLGEQFEAVLHWEKLINRYPESPFRADALFRTAEAYANRGDYRKALIILTDLIGDYPEEAAALGAQRRADELRYLLLGLSEREASLSSIIGREGGAASAKGREAMIELARLYIYEGGSNIELAYQMLNKVIEKEDLETSGQAQYLIGEYFFRKSEPLRAAEEFLKAAFINPEDSDLMAASIFRAAEMMELAGKPGEVKKLVERLERHFPDSQWTAEAKKLTEESR